jgi:hypothetical protein
MRLWDAEPPVFRLQLTGARGTIVAVCVVEARMGINADATLERAFIDTYLADRGYTRRALDDLPTEEREPLLRAALQFASLRLAEVESRARLLEEIQARERT